MPCELCVDLCKCVKYSTVIGRRKDCILSDTSHFKAMARWVVPTAVVLAVALLISLFFASSSSSAINSDKGSTALLIIDVQNCFMSGGTLAVAGADAVIPIINALRQDNQFDVIVATKDWHCPDHVSFASQHPGCKIYDAVNLTYLQNGDLCWSDAACASNTHAVNCSQPASQQRHVVQRLWPDHCVINTTDAQLSQRLVVEPSDVIVYKGYHCQIDSYSAFYDNGKVTSTDLHRILSERDVKTVFLVGVATDYCVYYSAKDAVSLGYKTYVVLDATRGVANSSVQEAVFDMRQSGIQLVSSSDVSSILSVDSSASSCSIHLSLVVVCLVLFFADRVHAVS